MAELAGRFAVAVEDLRDKDRVQRNGMAWRWPRAERLFLEQGRLALTHIIVRHGIWPPLRRRDVMK